MEFLFRILQVGFVKTMTLLGYSLHDSIGLFFSSSHSILLVMLVYYHLFGGHTLTWRESLQNIRGEFYTAFG